MWPAWAGQRDLPADESGQEEANLPLLTKRMGEKGLHVISVPLDEQLRLVSAAKQEV